MKLSSLLAFAAMVFLFSFGCYAAVVFAVILLSLALIWCNVYQLQRSERHAKQRFTRIQRVS